MYIIYRSKKEKSKEKKGLLHYVCMVLVILFTAYILFGIWLLVLRPGIPRKKTHFKSYAAFREKAFDLFPNALPDSASDISYYSYTGFFDECLGVAFTLEPEDYHEVISEYKNAYEEMIEARREFTFESKDHPEIVSELTKRHEEEEENKWDKSYSNEVLKGQISQDKSLSFLESLAGDNLSGYLIIFYDKTGGEDVATSEGVLGNEKTGRIVVFYLKDVFPEE